VAQQQGVVAARNMSGQGDEVNKHVPFFWTTQWGFTVRYVGHAEGWDEIITGVTRKPRISSRST